MSIAGIAAIEANDGFVWRKSHATKMFSDDAFRLPVRWGPVGLLDRLGTRRHDQA
jgi:hypothetical protein